MAAKKIMKGTPISQGAIGRRMKGRGTTSVSAPQVMKSMPSGRSIKSPGKPGRIGNPGVGVPTPVTGFTDFKKGGSQANLSKVVSRRMQRRRLRPGMNMMPRK